MKNENNRSIVRSNMSTGSIIAMENGQTLSDLFHKFIRMTVKTDQRDEHTRRKYSTTSSEQHRHPSAPRPPTTHRRHPRATLDTRPPATLRQTSTVTHFNLSSNGNDTHHPLEHSYTDNDENPEQGHGHADQVSLNTRLSSLFTDHETIDASLSLVSSSASS